MPGHPYHAPACGQTLCRHPHTHTHTNAHQRERGVATLVIALLLFLSMALVAALANSQLLHMQHTTSDQIQAGMAAEAADAGLVWAQVMLNHSGPIGSDCREANAEGALSLREQLLQFDPASGLHRVRTWTHQGNPRPVQVACVLEASGWQCSCPQGADPTPGTTSNVTPLPPAFLMQLQPVARPGTVQLQVIGCSNPGTPCLPTSQQAAEATSRAQLSLGLLPALATRPAAALTAGGRINAGSSPLGAYNPDPASGLAMHAGGDILAPAARLGGVAGEHPAWATVANDPALAAGDGEAMFQRHLGLPKDSWRQQAMVYTLPPCEAGCGEALRQALDNSPTRRLVWVGHDLQLRGPVSLGSAEHPVLLVVEGDLRLDGAVQIHGLVHTRQLRWDGSSTSVEGGVQGALVVEGDYQGNAAVDLVYDPVVLGRLQQQTGMWLPIPGSWRDF